MEENDQSCSGSNEEEAKFVRRLKKGTGKYKEIFHLSVLSVEEWDIMHQNSLVRKRKINLKGKRRTSLTKFRKRDNLKEKNSMLKKIAGDLKVLMNPLVNMEQVNSC